MATLYELTGKWLELYELADDPNIEEDVWLDTMAALDGEIEDKADNYAKFIRQLNVDAEALKEEEDRIYQRRKTLENRAKRVKDSLQTAMETTGKTKFKTLLFSFGIQNNAPTVVIDCPVDDLPEEFITRAEPKADKAAIKKIIESGVPFQFAHLERTQSLRIR